MGAQQGVALNTNECLKRKGFLHLGATCIKEECHTIKTQDAHPTSLYTHLLSDLRGIHQGVWPPCLWRNVVTSAWNTHRPAGVPVQRVHIHALLVFYMQIRKLSLHCRPGTKPENINTACLGVHIHKTRLYKAFWHTTYFWCDLEGTGLNAL